LSSVAENNGAQLFQNQSSWLSLFFWFCFLKIQIYNPLNRRLRFESSHWSIIVEAVKGGERGASHSTLFGNRCGGHLDKVARKVESYKGC